LSPPIVVVDSSVAIKWVVPEHDSDLAEQLVDAYSLVAPDLIYAECTNTLWKKTRRGEMSVSEAMSGTTVVDDFAVRTVSMRELVPLAAELSLRLDHAAYDCFYLALSQLLECPFVTADAKLHRKVHDLLPPEMAIGCMMLGAFPAATSDT